MVSNERDLIDSNKAGRLYSADVHQAASADQVSPPFRKVRALMRRAGKAWRGKGGGCSCFHALLWGPDNHYNSTVLSEDFL